MNRHSKVVKLTLPQIYPITDTRISGISISAQVDRLIAGGAGFIQIREKYASSHQFYESAAAAINIARANGTRIIINDRVDIALALKADGVHLGQDDLPCSEARAILGDDAIIGISTHSFDQARAALDLPVDYIAIGPIFSTSTKGNPHSVVGVEGLRKVRTLIGEFPLVAIGGITRLNIGSVFKAGADSAAVISGLISEENQITQRMQEFAKLNQDG